MCRDPTVLKAEGERREAMIMHQDGAIPHTGHDALRKLNLAGREGEWKVTFVMQPEESPDLSVNDLRLFAPLKSRV